MSEKLKRDKARGFVVLFGFLIIFAVVIKFYLSGNLVRTPQAPVPDNSPMGVTKNFYQWYTSCISEDKSTKSLKTCYQKPTYLTQDLIKKLDSGTPPVLCGKALDFYSVSVSISSQIDGYANVDVINSQTEKRVATTVTKHISDKWMITDIVCSK